MGGGGGGVRLLEGSVFWEAGVLPAPWHCGKAEPPENRMSDKCENITLGPVYNEHFNACKSACCSWVLIVTELFNIVVNEMVSAPH